MRKTTRQIPVTMVCPESYEISINLKDGDDSSLVYTERYSKDTPLDIIDRTVTIVEALGYKVERLEPRVIRLTRSTSASKIATFMIAEMELIRDSYLQSDFIQSL